jgi:hypothetical protein
VLDGLSLVALPLPVPGLAGAEGSTPIMVFVLLVLGAMDGLATPDPAAPRSAIAARAAEMASENCGGSMIVAVPSEELDSCPPVPGGSSSRCTAPPGPEPGWLSAAGLTVGGRTCPQLPQNRASIGSPKPQLGHMGTDGPAGLGVSGGDMARHSNRPGAKSIDQPHCCFLTAGLGGTAVLRPTRRVQDAWTHGILPPCDSWVSQA